MTGERILIVDDDEALGALFSRICRDEGYEVDLAPDGQAAITYLDNRAYALAVIDLRLPDMSGLKVLRRALVLDRGLPVIMLTGYATYESAVEALNLGAHEYVQKGSLSMQLIPVIIRRALEQRRLRANNEALILQLRQSSDELAHNRSQQMHSIQQVGLALAAGQQIPQVVEVLVQAVLDAVGCDGAAMLVIPDEAGDAASPASIVIGSRRPLAPGPRAALLDALLNNAAPPRLDASTVQVRSLASAAGLPDGEPWRRVEAARLAVRDHPLGMLVAAGHSARPFGEDALAMLRILVAQGSIAVENALLFERMRELATRDSLTGLHNRSHLHHLLETEISRSQRHGSHFAVIMVDVDRERGLKHINDTFGHQTGDAVLCEIAKALLANVRRADSVSRYGGDEFVVLAPETSQGEALVVANRLCRRLGGTPIRAAGREFPITVSVGASIYEPNSGLSSEALLALADKGMYEAKQAGGNRALVMPGT